MAHWWTHRPHLINSVMAPYGQLVAFGSTLDFWAHDKLSAAFVATRDHPQVEGYFL